MKGAKLRRDHIDIRQPIVAFVLIFLIAIVILYFYNFYLNQTISNTACVTLNETMEQQKQTLMLAINDKIANIKIISEMFEELLTDGSSNQDVIQIVESITEGSGFFNLAIAGKLGYVTSNNGENNINISDKDYFIRALNGETVVSDPFLSEMDGGKNITIFATPLRYNGLIEGVILGKVYTSELGKHITPAFSGRGSVNFLDKNGNNIFFAFDEDNPTYQFVGSNVFDLFSSDRVNFIENFTFEEMKSNMEAGISGHAKYEIDDKKRLMHYAPLGFNDWIIVSLVLEEIVIEPIRDTRRLSYFMTFFVIFLFVLYTVHAISSQSKYNKKIYKLAYYDDVTGAPNLNKLKADTTMILSKNMDKKFTGVYFKIKKMPLISDIFGVEISNAIVLHIVECMQDFVLENELFCRANYDEFAMLLTMTDEQRLISRLKNLEAAIVNLYGFSEETFRVQMVFGCYVIMDNSMSVDEIDRYTKIAVERALLDDRFESRIEFYNNDLREKLQFEKELEDSADKGLRHGDFIFYLQGKYNPVTAELVSAEALVRWLHHEKGMISPGIFIPLFERNGFVTEIDLHILSKVCKQLRRWLDNGVSPVPIAVNLSRNHLSNKNLVNDILDIIDSYEIPHELIELEITESAMGVDSKYLISVIRDLRNQHIHVALDDFGAGYSTLGTLKELVVDTLKLDREFFVDMASNKRSREVIKSILEMAKNLHLQTVAEGIEMEEQVQFLKNEQVDLIQGYYFSAPLPVYEFEKQLSFTNVEELT